MVRATALAASEAEVWEARRLHRLRTQCILSNMTHAIPADDVRSALDEFRAAVVRVQEAADGKLDRNDARAWFTLLGSAGGLLALIAVAVLGMIPPDPPAAPQPVQAESTTEAEVPVASTDGESSGG